MSDNQKKLNEQLLNVVKNEKDSAEAKLKKLKFLVRIGADVNAKGVWEDTALICAAKKGHLEVVECLAKNGADLDAGDRCAYIALMYAVSSGRLKVCQYLVEKGANIKARNNKGKTALDFAKLCEKRIV